MKIVVDSREQRPYEFQAPSEIGPIATGDYSLAGGEHLISIERKELGDLINCLSHDRERFERELYRARALEYFCLVLECSLSDLANGQYRSQMNPKSAIQSLLAFSIRYKLPVWFCETREYGQRLTESLLCKFAREIQKKAELIL